MARYTEWTDQMKRTAEKLRASGLTYADIAKMINRQFKPKVPTTMRAVEKRLMRLGASSISIRDSYIRASRIIDEVKKRRGAKKATFVVQLRENEPAPIGALNEITGPRQCRYMHGEVYQPPWKMCGARTPHPESSFCLFHEKVCYQIPPKRGKRYESQALPVKQLWGKMGLG